MFFATVSMAAGLGFEPRLTDPESAVLPLDDPAKLKLSITSYYNLRTCFF